MTGTVVYKAPARRYSHTCSLPNVNSFTLGTIIRCDDCGIYSKAYENDLDYLFWQHMGRIGLWWARRRRQIPRDPKPERPRVALFTEFADQIREDNECR